MMSMIQMKDLKSSDVTIPSFIVLARMNAKSYSQKFTPESVMAT
jgi:hypothetical protein